jgi:DNA-binding response OmpR family regulator
MAAVILVAEGDATIRGQIVDGLTAQGVADRVEGCDTGRSLVGAFTRVLRVGDSVAAVVLDTKLPAGGGKSSAIALRAVERAFDVPPAGLVFHTTTPRDENMDRVIEWLGQTAYRQRPADDPAGEASVAELMGAIQEVRSG